MIEFLINEKNKALWDKNFIKVDGSDDVQTCENGVWKKAEPLNNDPDIQEYGAVTDILKNGYFNKEYKIFNPESTEPNCFITNEQLKLYDAVLLINGWEEFNSFVVFMGTIENNTKYLFKYFYSGTDSIRNFTPTIKFKSDIKSINDKPTTESLKNIVSK